MKRLKLRLHHLLLRTFYVDGKRPTAWDDIQIEYINKLIDEHGITDFLETGTYQGNTSLYFWRRGLKIHTVEMNREYFNMCRKRFKGTDIEAVNMDSRLYLKQFLSRGVNKVIYYLDAHWEDCPLEDEIDQLLQQSSFLMYTNVLTST